MPAATPVPPADGAEPSSLLSIVDRTAYDRLIKSIADDLAEPTAQQFRGAPNVIDGVGEMEAGRCRNGASAPLPVLMH